MNNAILGNKLPWRRSVLSECFSSCNCNFFMCIRAIRLPYVSNTAPVGVTFVILCWFVLLRNRTATITLQIRPAFVVRCHVAPLHICNLLLKLSVLVFTATVGCRTSRPQTYYMHSRMLVRQTTYSTAAPLLFVFPGSVKNRSHPSTCCWSN